MKNCFNKIVLILGLFLFVSHSYSQSNLTAPNSSACPNQTVNVCSTWNNVASQSFTLYVPGGNPAGISVSQCFTISNASPNATTVTYTLVGNGIYNGQPTVNTAYPQLSIIPPAALSITNAGVYCGGDNAIFDVPLGGTSYTAIGPSGNVISSSNIMTIPNVQSPGYNGNYTITTVIAGCTRTGVTTVSVAPNNLIAVNSASSVCEGQSVNLTANLAGGNAGSFQWYDQQNNPVGPAGSANIQLNGLTPNQAGIYKVTANQDFNTPIGSVSCPRQNSVQVNVVDTEPVVASASPSGTLCQGANLSLVANAGNNVTSWQWTGPSSYFSTQQNPLISPALPINSGTYVVTAFFIGAVTCTQTATVIVNIIPVTTPVITMPNSICQGDPNGVAMSAAASNVSTWAWQGPYPAVVNGTNTASASFSNPQPGNSGTYYVTATFGSGSTQCSRTASAQLNVVPVNTISVVPPGQVCEPNNAVLQANATGANLFTWVGPNGFSSPGANVTVYYPSQSANGIYTVTAYFGGGNITCSNTNTVQLVVNPVLNFSLEPRQQVCYNTPITIVGPSGATGYTWTSSTGFTSNDKDANLGIVQPKHAGTYTLQVSLGPCISGDDSELEILDPISYTLTPYNRTICKGDTIVVEGGVTGGSENYAYLWNPPIYLDAPIGPKRTAVPLGSIIYNLVVHDIACPNYTIAHAFSVTVNEPPNPTVSLAQDVACAPLQLFLSSGTQTESAITTWDFGGTKQIQGDGFFYSLTEPGTYTLKVHSKGRNGCSGMYEYPFPIIVQPRPGTGITWQPEKPTTDDEITFVPTHEYESVIRYTWTFQGGITQGDTNKINTSTAVTIDTNNVRNPIRKYFAPGKYPVMLVSVNEMGCSDTVVKFIDVIDDLRIFVPNTFTPNDDKMNDLFFVKGIGIRADNFLLEIMDRSGTLIFSTKDPTEAWDGTIRGTKVKDGTYIYKIRVIGMNGEGRKDIIGYVNVVK
jgi:gliding motility-associated-like protein